MARIPLSSQIACRDVSLTKDALLTNCYEEDTDDGGVLLKRRPGLSVIATATSLLGTVVLSSGGAGYLVGDVLTLTGGSPVSAGQIVVDTLGGGGSIATFHIINAGNGYVSVPTGITGGTGAGATLGSATLTGVSPGGILSVAFGDNPNLAIFGGTLYTISVLNSLSILLFGLGDITHSDFEQIVSSGTTYNCIAAIRPSTSDGIIIYKSGGGAWTSLSTSTINAAGRGIVALDGYFFCNTTTAIRNSNLLDPSTWPALSTISMSTNDTISYITRMSNLIVALGQENIEFFYNAGNSTGSPLSPALNMLIRGMGCADPWSCVTIGDAVFFMARDRFEHRTIQILTTSGVKKISNGIIDKLLNQYNFSQNFNFESTQSYSYRYFSGKEEFYVLTFQRADTQTFITLAYNLSTSKWSIWTSLSANSGKVNPTVTVDSNNLVTVTFNSHGYSDGDAVTFSACSNTNYNGTRNIFNVTTNTFQFQMLTAPGAFGTGTMNNFTETSFNISCTNGIARYNTNEIPTIFAQDRSNGNLYLMGSSYLTDNGTPITMKARTQSTDGGTPDYKFCNRLNLVGDNVATTSLIRYTNDDYQTYSGFRPINHTNPKKQIYRLGRFKDRAFEIVNSEATSPRISAIDVDIEKGTM